MKKLKQALLSDLCRKHGQEKTSAAKRPCGSVKSKATVKKIPKENIPQDPKPADESKLKSFRTPLTSAKLNQPKKNKRSKSMICDKRFKTKIETTHNSSELAMQFNCIRLD